MQNLIMVFMGLICCVDFFCAGEAKALDLTVKADKQGYSIGYQMGSDFQLKKIQINPDALVAGFKDGMDGVVPGLDEQQMNAVFSELQRQVEEEQQVQFKKIADNNKLAGTKFMAENGVKEGVITLPSGLQYKVVKAGDGKTPTVDSKVTVHYRGTFPDGTEFDSSYRRGTPISWPVKKFVPGWIEALQLMPIGSKWLLYVPGELGYGEFGSPPKIGPNQALLFELELLAVD